MPYATWMYLMANNVYKPRTTVNIFSHVTAFLLPQFSASVAWRCDFRFGG